MKIEMSEKEYKAIQAEKAKMAYEIAELKEQLEDTAHEAKVWYTQYQKAEKQAIQEGNIYDEILYQINKILLKEQNTTVYKLLTRKYGLKHIKRVLNQQEYKHILYATQHVTMRAWCDKLIKERGK